MLFQKRKFSSIVLCSCLICFVSVTLLMVSGCAPLKKKFTRQKKKDKDVGQKFIPVLDPIDYPEAIQSSKERYKHHYSLWKVWNKDLLQNIERDGSEKRQKYLLNQSIVQLEEMQKWVIEEKQAELARLVDGQRKIQKEYDKPPSMRNKFSVKRKIELNAKAIRNGFAPRFVFSNDG